MARQKLLWHRGSPGCRDSKEETTKLSEATLDPFLYLFLHSHQAHVFRGLGADFPVTALTPKFLKTLECHCCNVFSLHVYPATPRTLD